MSGRKIFFFIDGTSCNYSKRTNIHRMHKLFEKQPDCHCLYHLGIAANSSLKAVQVFIASEMVSEAVTLYARLSDLNVCNNDRLYIFGYSRGAILARMLAQMITNTEALETVIKHTDHPYQVMKNTVNFLGLFDPVIGLPYFFERKAFERMAYRNPLIQSFTEIVAVDEGFCLFASESLPATYKPPKIKPDNIVRPIYSAHELGNDEGRLVKDRKHILIAGVHGDIGGQDPDLTIATHATLTMLDTLFISNPETFKAVNTDLLKGLKSNISIADPIIIGAKTATYKKILQKKRSFSLVDGMELHPVSDKLVGKKVTKYNLLNFTKKYSIPTTCSSLQRKQYIIV